MSFAAVTKILNYYKNYYLTFKKSNYAIKLITVKYKYNQLKCFIEPILMG